MLKHRLLSGLTFSALALAAILMAPWWLLLAVILIFTGMAQWEVLDLTLGRGTVGIRPRVTAVALGILVVATAIYDGAAGRETAWLPLVLVLAVMLLLFDRVLAPSPLAAAQSGGLVLSIAYVALCLGIIGQVAWGLGAPDWPALTLAGRLRVLFMLWIVKISDTGAYAIGTAWGRHKLCPRVSPAKTWEGLAGGLVGGMLASVSALLIFRALAPSALEFGMWDALALGIILPLAGTAGDLAESMLKRAAGVKDSGHWLPGVGGLLDVLDSILFAGPIYYLYIQWVP